MCEYTPRQWTIGSGLIIIILLGSLANKLPTDRPSLRPLWSSRMSTASWLHHSRIDPSSPRATSPSVEPRNHVAARSASGADAHYNDPPKCIISTQPLMRSDPDFILLLRLLTFVIDYWSLNFPLGWDSSFLFIHRRIHQVLHSVCIATVGWSGGAFVYCPRSLSGLDPVTLLHVYYRSHTQL
jgi:hypothetical protein